MNIQIGLPCEPDWLCQGIGLLIGLVVLVLMVGLVRSIRSQTKTQAKKKRSK